MVEGSNLDTRERAIVLIKKEIRIERVLSIFNGFFPLLSI